MSPGSRHLQYDSILFSHFMSHLSVALRNPARGLISSMDSTDDDSADDDSDDGDERITPGELFELM